MPEEQLRLPRSSYEELAKIITAYGQRDEPTDLTEISKIVGINRTVISGNARFLTGVEILEPGQRKKVTPKGRGLAHALEHQVREEIQKHWRLVIGESEFLSRLVKSIRIRGGMDEATLVSHIAYSAGEKKTRAVMTGARTVVDILRAADLIGESDGKITLLADVGPPPDVEGPGELGAGGTAPDRTAAAKEVALGVGRSRAVVAVQVSIELHVNCNADELEGLGEKMGRVVEAITSASGGTDSQGQPGEG
jgi:hypothetical protein